MDACPNKTKSGQCRVATRGGLALKPLCPDCPRSREGKPYGYNPLANAELTRRAPCCDPPEPPK